MAKGKDQLADSRVSEAQCKKAVDALHDWASKKATKDAENELLPGKEPVIWLCVAVKQSPSGMSFKPVRIPIVHPIVDPRTNNVCLLTKDPQREYKDLLESHDIKFISRVVGLAKLKGKFNAFEARRALLKENGLFLADQSIIPLLPKLLGAKWFAAKKQPIPVCMTRKDLKAELERAINSTYMNQNKGTSISIKIGTLSQKPSQILANLKSAIPAVANHIKGGEAGWENIQSIGIKTNNSVYLPIWSCTLDDAEGGRWAGLTAADEDIEMDGDEEASEDEPPIPEKKPVAKVIVEKGKKKRAAEDDDEVAPETAKPKKKAKSQDSSTAPETAPAQPKKRKTAEVPEPTPAAVDEKPTKKRRKSDVTATPTAPVVSEATTEATASKSRKKANATAAPAVMEVEPTPVTVTPPTETKSKKRKKGDAGAAAELVDLPATEVTLSQSKKKKKATVDVPEEPPATPAAVVEASKTEEKKRKDRKSVSAEDASVAESLPPPVPTSTTPDEATPGKKSKKEKRKSISSVEAASEPVVEVTKEVEVEETVLDGGASEEKTEKKKRRKVKKTAQAKVDVEEIVAAPEQPSILNKEEMKQKKAASAVGEKKKEKVVKSKAGKSAKDALLGKKAAQ